MAVGETLATAVLAIATDFGDALAGMTKMSTGVKGMSKDFDKSAGPAVDGFAGKIGGALGAVSKFAGPLGLALGAGALVGFAKGSIDAAGALVDLQSKTGVGTSALQQFQYAGGQMGISLETITGNITKFQTRLANGDASAIGAVNKLGLSFDTLRGMKPEDQFKALAAKVADVEDPMARAKLATDLFGKSGAELIPALSKEFLDLTERANSLGIVMDEETVASMDSFGDTLSDLGSVGMALIGKVLSPFMPLLSGIAQLALKLASVFSDVLGWAIDKIGEGLKWLANGWINMERAILQGMLNLANSVPGLNKLTGASDGLTWALGKLDDMQAGLNKSQTETKKSTVAVNTAFDDESKSAKKAKDSVQDLADVFSGKKLAKEIDETAAALTRAGGASALSAFQLDEVGKKADEFRKQGGKLTPELEALAIRHEILNTKVSDTDKGFQKLLSSTPAVSKAMLDMVPPLEKIGTTDLAKLLDFGKLTPEQLNVKKPGEMFKEEFSRNVGSFMQNDFPTTIMSAITGGGNVFEAAGSSIGSFLTSPKGFGTKLTSGLTSVFGKGLGGAFASLMPGIGAMMGPLLGKISDAVVKVFSGNTTKKAREEFATSMGMTLDGLYSKLQAMGAKGQQLANTALNIIGKHDEAGNKKWMSEVSAFLDETQKKEEDLAAAAAEAFTKAQGAIGDALGKVITENIKSQEEFDRLSRIGLNTFNTLVASGVAPVEAMQRVGGAVDVLIASLESTGFKGNAAFDQLKRWRELTAENAPLLDQVGGLNELMEMTTTLGGMNADVFRDMQAQGVDAYAKLLAAGFTEAEARAQIKPLLEREIQLSKDKGFAIDEATQKIIDQARANGELSDESMSTNTILMDGLAAVIEAVGGKLPDAWRKVTGAAKDSAEAAALAIKDNFTKQALDSVRDVRDGISGLFDDFSGGLDIPVKFDVSGMPGLDGVGAIPMAAGGFGRVTRPTLFLAGEAGSEDFAFSGAGRSFGSSDTSEHLAAISSKLDRLGDVVVPIELTIDPDKLDRRVIRVSRSAHARGEIPVRADSVKTRVPNG